VNTPTQFDVFLSHNARDKPTVERIAEKLKRAGIEPWLDIWWMTPGSAFPPDLANGLAACSTCAVFIGPNGIGNWQNEEFQLAMLRAARDKTYRLFIVLLPGLAANFDYNSLPPFLTTRTWVDLRAGIDDTNAFQQLINAVKGIAPGAPVLARDEAQCPYLGLRPFDESDAPFFFGRDAELQRLIEKLGATRFLAVLGASGSGKSSLVRAGLLPKIRSGALPQSDTWTIIPPFTPGAHPLANLAAALLKCFPHDSMQKTLDQMSADERTLHLASTFAMSGQSAHARIVWMLDQFEEAFTLCQDADERARFFDNLLFAATEPGGPSIIIVTLRSDFYSRCAMHPELAAQISARQFLVGDLLPDGWRQIIEEPARRVNLELENGLTATILKDVANQPGALPLLEHALFELWQARRGKMLTLEAYRATGGVDGAIAKRADELYQNFDAAHQAATQRILLRLTQPGEGTEDTRRHATKAELITREDERTVIDQVLERFTNARLLTAYRDELTGNEMVDVAHEALIRGWTRLQHWLEQNRAGLRVHRRLAQAAERWQQLQHDAGALYRGLQLLEASEWRKQNENALNDQERAFLDASVALKAREEEIEREQQRRELAAAKQLAETAQARAHAERRGRLVTLGLLIATAMLAIVLGYTPARNALLRQQALGATLISIPAGETELGDQRNANGANLHFLPAGKRTLAGFQIEPYEVTNERYQWCVDAGQCFEPNTFAANYRGENKRALPVTSVNAIQASQFCAWLGRALPTDLEWERAARYVDGRPWTWGITPPTAERANFFFGTLVDLQPVTANPAGRSPEGVFNLAGNAWEWTRSAYDQKSDWTYAAAEPPTLLSVRGGGKDTSVSAMSDTLAYRLNVTPFSSDVTRGFRCVAH
jgi:formylglycine-generating enzyme required for sulfatase activity